MAEQKEEALGTASEWQNKRRVVWTDRSRLDDRRVAAAAVWWEEAHTLPLWTGASTGAVCSPIHKPAGWTGHPFDLGTNKEVFGAEANALYNALRLHDKQAGRGQQYTLPSDFTAAISRIASDAMG